MGKRPADDVGNPSPSAKSARRTSAAVDAENQGTMRKPAAATLTKWLRCGEARLPIANAGGAPGEEVRGDAGSVQECPVPLERWLGNVIDGLHPDTRLAGPMARSTGDPQSVPLGWEPEEGGDQPEEEDKQQKEDKQGKGENDDSGGAEEVAGTKGKMEVEEVVERQEKGIEGQGREMEEGQEKGEDRQGGGEERKSIP